MSSELEPTPSLSEPDDDGIVNAVVVSMKRALMNEKAAPELLPFETEIVAELAERLKSQQDILDGSTFGPSDAVYAALYQMEADRIRYILASYYRTRLAKIKKHVFFLLTEWTASAPLLSPQERDFVVKYGDLKDAHFASTVLSALPSRFSALEEREMVTPPNLAEWVFCLVLKEVGDFLPPDAPTADPIRMSVGDALIVKYSTVRELVKDKSVCLS